MIAKLRGKKAEKELSFQQGKRRKPFSDRRFGGVGGAKNNPKKPPKKSKKPKKKNRKEKTQKTKNNPRKSQNQTIQNQTENAQNKPEKRI